MRRILIIILMALFGFSSPIYGATAPTHAKHKTYHSKKYNKTKKPIRFKASSSAKRVKDEPPVTSPNGAEVFLVDSVAGGTQSLGLQNLDQWLVGLWTGVQPTTLLAPLAFTQPFADTGIANVYAVAISPAPTLTNGYAISFVAKNTNTGSSTLSVNGIAYPLVLSQTLSTLPANAIQQKQLVNVVYDGTNFQLQNPWTGSSTYPAVNCTDSSCASTDQLQVFDSTNTATSGHLELRVPATGPPQFPNGAVINNVISTQTGTSYVILASDSVVTFNNSSAVTATLMANSTVKGQSFILANLGTGTVTVGSAGSDVIVGAGSATATSISLTTGHCASLTSDGVGHWIYLLN